MRKSHLISLFILFIAVTVLILAQAFTGPESDVILDGPTRSPITAPPTNTKEPGETATPTPTATPVVRPVVNYGDYDGLSTEQHIWYANGTRESADKITYYIAPELQEVIKDSSSLYTLPGGTTKRVYLTFDLGYLNEVVDILDVLKTTGVKATFFVPKNFEALNGEDNEEKVANVLKRIIEEGHTMGVRDAVGVSVASSQEFCDNLWALQEIYERYVGNTKRIQFYRPNQLSKRNIALAEAMGYTVVLSSRTINGESSTTNILNDMVNNTADGVIFNLYAVRNQADVLDSYISQMTEKGYTFSLLNP